MYLDKKYSPFRYNYYLKIADEIDDTLERFGEFTLDLAKSVLGRLEIKDERRYYFYVFERVERELSEYLKRHKKTFEKDKSSGALEKMCLGKQQQIICGSHWIGQ